MTSRILLSILCTLLCIPLAHSQDQKNPELEAASLEDKKHLSPQELQKKMDHIVPKLVAATVAVRPGAGVGSGVIISPNGLILTAAHVTRKPGAKLSFLLSDGREVEGVALGLDDFTDAGLAKITSPGPFPYCPYITEKTYEIGDWVLALGHPGGPHYGRPTPVRLGRISRAGEKSGYRDPITTTALVISGDSGGPLFDLEGRVIGINSNVSSADWSTNNHVPLPAFIETWDRLMANEHITEQKESQEVSIEDPFSFQREYFFNELAKRPDDKMAHLLVKPKLLDPQQIQRHLDRWAIEADKSQPFDPNNYFTDGPEDLNPAQTMYLGIELNSLEVLAEVVGIEANSPAAIAGLQVGDKIVKLDGREISNTRSFAHSLDRYTLSEESTVVLKLQVLTKDGSEKQIELKPNWVPARRYFTQPLSWIVNTMMRNAATVPLSEELKKQNKIFESLLPQLDADILTILRDGKQVTLATAIREDGFLLTKASEITNKKGELLDALKIKHKDETKPIILITVDKVNDLAIIKCDFTDLKPVQFSTAETSTAEILVSPTSTKKRYLGISTQPNRHAPKQGYDHRLLVGSDPAYLGVSIDESGTDKVKLIVSTIAPESPAETAGFIEGDEIVSVDGEQVTDLENFTNKIRARQPGERTDIVVQRIQDKITLKVILGDRKVDTTTFSQMADLGDQGLIRLSANGGTLSKRRQGFPEAIYHDTQIDAKSCGGPIINLNGDVVGINISRSLRHRSLAIPASTVIEFIKHLENRDTNSTD